MPQGNIELMPKKEILDFKPAPLKRLATNVPRDGAWQASRRMMP